jgi:hypothetical protein
MQPVENKVTPSTHRARSAPDCPFYLGLLGMQNTHFRDDHAEIVAALLRTGIATRGFWLLQ